MTKLKKIPAKLQVWVDARKRFHLSDAHIQMARELGMNPKKFGGLANHDQERWKVPLAEFIEGLYFKQFGKDRPDEVISIESLVQRRQQKREARKARKESRVENSDQDEVCEDPF